jgi:hypothetical protein
MLHYHQVYSPARLYAIEMANFTPHRPLSCGPDFGNQVSSMGDRATGRYQRSLNAAQPGALSRFQSLMDQKSTISTETIRERARRRPFAQFSADKPLATVLTLSNNPAHLCACRPLQRATIKSRQWRS